MKISPESALRKEQILSRSANALLLGVSITAVATLGAQHSVWKQYFTLMHLVLGVIYSLVALPYFSRHFLRTLGFRRWGMLISGVLLFLLFLAVAITGWHIAIYGRYENLTWIFILHLISAALFWCTLLVHIATQVLWFPHNRRHSHLGFFPSQPRTALVTYAGFSVVVVLVVIFLSALYAQPSVPEPVARSDYSNAYGTHPFRPSQTETSHGGFVKPSEIANSGRCLHCHQDIGKQWLSSVHQQAASDPTYVTNINLLVDNKGIEAARYCEGCHAPVALLTGALTPGGKHAGMQDSIAHHEGVSCMSCHGIHSMPHLRGVASYEFSPAQPYLFASSQHPLLLALNARLIKIDPAQHKRDMGADILKDPKVCASCHTQFMDEDMNNWGWVKMQDEYAAWLAGPFSQHQNNEYSSKDYVRCQDCHMPLVAAFDPSANHQGMVRGHHFPGANTFLPLLRGDKQQFDTVKQFLQANKVRLHIEKSRRLDAQQSRQFVDGIIGQNDEFPTYYYLGEKATVNIVVTNVGVGHNFPAGTIDINEVWVEFKVVDALGEEIFSSGLIDNDGNVDPDAYFYRAIPIDRFGKHVWKHDLFNMVGEISKRVIEAGEADIIHFAFHIPAWAKSPITLSAKLRYRKLNNRYARWALKEKYIDIPPVDMAWDSVSFPIKVRKETITPTHMD